MVSCSKDSTTTPDQNVQQYRLKSSIEKSYDFQGTVSDSVSYNLAYDNQDRLISFGSTTVEYFGNSKYPSKIVEGYNSGNHCYQFVLNQNNNVVKYYRITNYATSQAYTDSFNYNYNSQARLENITKNNVVYFQFSYNLPTDITISVNVPSGPSKKYIFENNRAIKIVENNTDTSFYNYENNLVNQMIRNYNQHDTLNIQYYKNRYISRLAYNKNGLQHLFEYAYDANDNFVSNTSWEYYPSAFKYEEIKNSYEKAPGNLKEFYDLNFKTILVGFGVQYDPLIKYYPEYYQNKNDESIPQWALDLLKLK